MDIFNTLKTDHRIVRTLMARLAADNGEIPARRTLFNQVKQELIAHFKAEDQTFYGQIEHEPTLGPKISAARAEHDHIEALLDELEDLPIEGERWPDKYTALSQCVEAHFREEEGEIFELAGEMLDSEKAKELGKAMEKVEDEYRMHL